MNLNQPTLIKFEEARKAANHIPPLGSNSFFTVGNAQINLLTKRNDPDNYRFEIFTDSGELEIGDGVFNISGDINNTEYPYENFTVIQNASVIISGMLGIYKGKFEAHGIVRVRHGYITIRNNGAAILYRDSDFIIDDGLNLQIDDGSSLTIYGKIYIHVNEVDKLLSSPNVIVDPAAVIYVNGLETLGQRLYSLTDYYTELSQMIINVNTQGEKNFIRGIGRIGYLWTDGNPLKRYQIIQMIVLYGHAILGDFKLSVLGLPEEGLTDSQIIDTLTIKKGSTLHITSEYNSYRYIHPELYLGIIIGNSKAAGVCEVEGSLIVSGENSCITIDRGASIHIHEDANIIVENGAMIKSTNNDLNEVLFIDGTLIIDDIEQISTFVKENIVFGDKGKIIINNPDRGERRVLFSTPNGINGTELYRLFGDRLDMVEYHISNNTGIEIDQNYEFFHKDFVSWYNGLRIEKAVYDKFIIWHDGGFIKLSKSIIPWVNEECNLYHASRIFKSTGSFDEDRLQDVVNRLKYAGFGNITFIFEYGDKSHDVTMVLDEVNMVNTINNPMSKSYVLYTDTDGELFMRNNLPIVKPETIISKESVMIELEGTSTSFNL